jgi:hypothetical protein
MTDNDLIEWLETAIDDSFDLGWTSLDAAKLIVSRMQAEGLAIVKAEPVAVERVAKAICKQRHGHLRGYKGREELYGREADAAIAALTGRV